MSKETELTEAGLVQAETMVILASIFFVKPQKEDCFTHSCFVVVRADFDPSQQSTADLITSSIVDDLSRHRSIHEWAIGHVTLREVDADELEYVLPAARRRVSAE